MPNVLRALAIVFYVAVVELSNHISIATPCLTEDCKQTVEDYTHIMDLNANPCQDFFQYACGNFQSFLRSHGAFIHIHFLLDQYNESTAELLSPRLDTPIAAGDSDIIKAAKLRFQLCTTTPANQKINQVVQFLNNLARFETWWELENYTVKKGFESSIFWMSRWFNDGIDQFTLHPRESQNNMEELVSDINKAMPLLKNSGQLSNEAQQLLNSCPGNDWASSKDVENSDPPPMARNIMDDIPDAWIAEQDTASELSREDWYKYFNNWWSDSSNNVDMIYKTSIIGDTPNLLSRVGSRWLDSKDSIKTNVMCFALWQLLQIIDLSGQGGDSKCFTLVDSSQIGELDKETKFFPDSLKKSVQALSATVELQTKLRIYKELPKHKDANEFMGTAKLGLYNHLVSDAEKALLALNQNIMENKCCGNCDMDQVKKAAGRVMRFERRYPRDEPSFWIDSSASDSDEKEQSRTLFRKISTSGMLIGPERNKAIPAQHFNVSGRPTTFLDLVFEQLRMARWNKYTWFRDPKDTIYKIVEALTMANKPGVKFRKDRPAALNYGGLGAIIAANFPESLGEDSLYFKDVQRALDIAWGAYLYDKQRGYRDYGRLSSLPNSDDNKLFFLAFANNMCEAQEDRDKINNILQNHEGFKAAYCATQGQPQQGSAYRPTPTSFVPED